MKLLVFEAVKYCNRYVGISDCLMSMQKLNIYNQATIWNLDSCTYYDFQNVIEYPDLNQIYCAQCMVNSKTGKLMLWM